MAAALVVLIPLIGAVVPALAARASRNLCAAATAAVTAAALVLLLAQAPAVHGDGMLRWGVDWVPQIGLRFSFFIDGLGLFFAGLILGIGLLIILYARFYLGSADPIGRFYAYLLLFQGAMLGIVLSENILLLIVFWELTSLSSFLLIGYWHTRAESRQGARMALVVTGGGGLALIAGMLLLGQAAGSYELSEILARGAEVRSSPLCIPALVLILLGAFTKSAQFPFHFWLPHAMAAPTPVSAYLHSATMVKAGIFLLARLWPVFAATDTWFLVVSLTGLVTMVIAAWIALFKDDLKLLLAFSTVSHLGLVTMLLGIGSPLAAVTAVFHILNHATFKAALFMSAGIVDHEAGTRNLRRLGGLARLLPITAVLTLVAAASMAGVPLLNGFLSKEMMLEQASLTAYAGLPWLFPLLATAGAALSVAYSARLAFAVFFGPTRYDSAHLPHDPPVGMWLPVAILIVPVIAIGLLPVLAQPLVEQTAVAVVGGPLPSFYLALWHGFTPALAMSAVAFVGGALVLAGFARLERLRRALPRPEAKRMFEQTVRASADAARIGIDRLHANDLQRYVMIVSVAVIALGGYAFLGASHGAGNRVQLPVSLPVLVGWLVLAACCLAVALRHRDRFLLLLLTGAAGFIVSLAFLQFSAPDLALTQISVEVVTTILLLLALNLLPKTTPSETGPARRFADAGIAVVAGTGVAALAYAILTRGFESISNYHLAESVPGGGGTNVVNVILVDFRAFDTFGEIIVLGIAGIAIYALLDSALSGRAGRRLATLHAAPRSADAHPLMLVIATRILLPLALTAGIYIFLRGHNLPGGGFIAGIVVAIAFIMQYVASGYGWTSQRVRFDAQSLIGWGITIAGLGGIGAWLFGYPFLTSTHGHFDIPLIGDFELSSVIVFDLGVFLTVVGTVLLALATLSRVETPEQQRAAAPAAAPQAAAAEPARPRIAQEERV